MLNRSQVRKNLRILLFHRLDQIANLQNHVRMGKFASIFVIVLATSALVSKKNYSATPRQGLKMKSDLSRTYYKTESVNAKRLAYTAMETGIREKMNCSPCSQGNVTYCYLLTNMSLYAKSTERCLER